MIDISVAALCHRSAQEEGRGSVWDALTCVDELDVALQVAVDHEDLVAAGMRARPLPHLLVMLFDVLLQNPEDDNQLFVPSQSNHESNMHHCMNELTFNPSGAL